MKSSLLLANVAIIFMTRTGGQDNQYLLNRYNWNHIPKKGCLQLCCSTDCLHGSSDVSSCFFSTPAFFFVFGQAFATRALLPWYMIVLLTSDLRASGAEAVGVNDLAVSPSSSILVCAFGQVT